MHEHMLLQLALILAAAKVAGEVCDRWLKQPAVLGELVAGIVLGPSVLGWIPGSDAVLLALAALGAVLLLFMVGLETDLAELGKVGGAAVWVACFGAAVQFGGGCALMAALGYGAAQAVFVAGALTATSIGISARVFADLRILQQREPRIVLGAAVVDDVIGLIILAAIGGGASGQAAAFGGICRIVVLAVAFLAGAVLLGLWLTPHLLKWAQRMQTRAAVSSAAMAFCLLVSALASAVSLAPVIGAFAAGLVLARAEHRVHFDEKLKAVADLLVPVFFVTIGARMNAQALSPATPGGRAALLLGALLVAVTLAGKLLVGLSTPGRGLRRLIVGAGMLPRGEVALIFAGAGLAAGVLNQVLFAVIVFVVVCTTCASPLLLKLAAKQSAASPT